MRDTVWKLRRLIPCLFVLLSLVLAPMALAAPDKPEVELTHSGDGRQVKVECTGKMAAPDGEGRVEITLSLQTDSRLTVDPGSIQAIYQTEDGESAAVDEDHWDFDRNTGLLVVSLEVDTDMGGQLLCRLSGQVTGDSQKKLTNTAKLEAVYQDPDTDDRTELEADARDEIQPRLGCSLTLDLNGGSLSGKGSAFVWQDDLSQGQQVNLGGLPQPARSGYFFDGWTLASGAGAKVENGSLTVGSGDIVLRAVWTSKADQLTLDLNGGSGRQVTVSGTTGEDVIVPYPSEVLYSRDGYKLAGWCTTPDSQSGTRYTGGESFTLTREDDILYAWWAPQYTLVYDANGGTGQMPRRIFAASEEAVISDNVFTRTGYDFLGWCLSPDGRGTLYQAGDTLTLTGDTVLYAQWEKVYEEPPAEKGDSHLLLLLGILALAAVCVVCVVLLWKRRNDDDGPYDDGGYDDGYDDGYEDDYDDDRYGRRRDGYRERDRRDRSYDREDRYRDERYRDRDPRDGRRDRRDRRRYDDRYDD